MQSRLSAMDGLEGRCGGRAADVMTRDLFRGFEDGWGVVFWTSCS